MKLTALALLCLLGWREYRLHKAKSHIRTLIGLLSESSVHLETMRQDTKKLLSTTLNAR